jgi:adenylate kinase family enzyme
MKRVVILGPGASGRSTLAFELGAVTGLRMIELDKIFWQPGLVATPRDEWAKVQARMVEQDGWIMDGDLGPHDALEIRLRAADAVIVLDFSVLRCAWRAVRRSREQIEFWLWRSARSHRACGRSSGSKSGGIRRSRSPRSRSDFLQTGCASGSSM